MSQKNPYEIVKRRYITEKATLLSSLKDAKNNASVRKCESPKYVFLVDPKANKQEIADAIEEIYATRNIKVKKVNTIIEKPKVYARKGNRGQGKGLLVKKAIVTLARGDTIED
jgi:large subunit ribosomal protein L23